MTGIIPTFDVSPAMPPILVRAALTGWRALRSTMPPVPATNQPVALTWVTIHGPQEPVHQVVVLTHGHCGVEKCPEHWAVITLGIADSPDHGPVVHVFPCENERQARGMYDVESNNRVRFAFTKEEMDATTRSRPMG
jgi:hypothetical protein